jgi:membrane protein
MGVSRGLVWNTVRSLFGTLDSIAYTLFSWVMQLIFDIAEVSTSDAFNNFYGEIQSRIYAVLAIFMLFKVTISMLTYLVNPDSITDKSNGIGKLSTRIIVSLVMLIAFPYAFQFLNRVQPHVLEALPRVILGTQPSSYSDLGSQMENAGQNIAFQTYNGVFFNTNCADKEAQVGVSNGNPCFQYENSVQGAVDHLNDPADGDNNSYKYDYMPLIGFVVAIVMTLILLGYCVDIAVRVFKLIILQLIAPIPIISYVDPKASKDGAFNKWIKMVISVWADLFIKLGIIYFIMLVISELFTSGAILNLTNNLFGDSYFRGGLVTLALIVGLLFFAKDAPKFICDAMGIKMGENGKLFGGLGKIMSAGAIAAGTVGAGIASGRASYLADQANGKKFNVARAFKNVGAGFLGAAAGGITGMNAAVNAKDHNTKAVMDAMAKRNATALAAGSSGSTFFGRMGSTLMGLTTGETLAAIGKREISDLEAKKSALETVKSRVSGEMVKQDWTWGKSGFTMKDANGKDLDMKANYKSFMATKNAAASAGKDKFKYTFKVTDSSGVTHDVTKEITMQQANMQEGFILKNNEDDYIVQHINGTVKTDKVDKTLMADIQNAEKITDVSITNRSSITDNIDKFGVQIMDAKRENAKKEANDRFSGTGK